MRLERRSAIGRVLVAVIILVVIALSGLAIVLNNQTSIKPNSVSLETDFSPNSQDAPYWYGMAQGIYKQNNVNLTVIPGTSVDNAIAALVAGKVDFAEAQLSDVLSYAVNNNASNIKMVALVYEKSTVTIVYNSATIKSLSDLDGKTGSMVSPTSGTIAATFTLFAKANNLNVSSMNIEYNPVATSDDLLLEGKVQFIVVALANYNNVQATGETEGLNFGYFVMADYGLNETGFGIVTTDTMIQQNPGIVSSFVKATMQSYVSAYSNPTEAITDLVNANPTLNYTSTLEGFKQVIACCAVNATTLSNPLQYGWMNPQFMQQSFTIAETAANLSTNISPTSLYTNQFVQQP